MERTDQAPGGNGDRPPRERRSARRIIDEGGGPSPFEPLTAELRYRPPRAEIDPDQSKGWIRRVMPLVKSHWVIFVLALGGSLVSMFCRVLVPRYVGYAVDQALIRPAGTRVSLGHFITTLAIIAVVGLASSMVSRYYLFRSAYVIEYDLRVIMYRHFTRLSFPFYDRVQSGQLISRANSDIRSVQMFLAFGPFFIVQFSLFAVAMYFMLQINVALALLSILTLPAVFFVGVGMRNRMFPVSWIMQARMADIATIVDENVNGVRVVKSFAAEKQQIGELADAAQRLRWISIRLINVRARYGPLMENLTGFGQALILLYGGILVINGKVGPGDLLVFLTYLALLQAPFRMLGFLLMMQQRAAASAGRIYEVLDEVPDIQDRPGAFDLVESDGDIEFRDVHFTYRDGPKVFDGLNLHIPSGQTVAIVGRTGSGKTTLAELLPRFYDVDGGAMLVDGHDVRDLTLTSLRSHIGICFDEPFLFSASLRDNIAYGRPDAPMEDVVEAAKAAGADEFIDRLEDGYDTIVGERGYTLSGGQRQRIAIARTILENPDILILDDATSAIDVKIELQIHDALRRLVSGRTTLIIAHRLSTISLAERVVLLEGGKVVADGTHLELMATEPRYAAVLAHMEEEDELKAEHVDESAHPPHPLHEAHSPEDLVLEAEDRIIGDETHQGPVL
jgi:ATP-binding cassette subfamily B protein